LIAGAVTQRPAADYLAAFRTRDILVATAGADVVRFLPPLIVEKDRIGEVVDVFDEILRQGVR
jgi:acetylornithine/N-succinyldiaminopimelate aminotransferase